jgi:exosortase
MDSSTPKSTAPKPAAPPFGWAVLAVLLLALWGPVLLALWDVWRSDPTLTHGPFVPLVALALLWMRRDDLRRWDQATPSGLAAVGVCSLLFVGAYWADIEFFKPLTLIGITLSLIAYFGGAGALKASAGPLAFLMFMIPWPTTVVERLAFPLQLTSSAYSALLGGMIGLNIHRDGIQMAVLNEAGTQPVYAVTVARACSGLTSLIVLLALGYLVAYFTQTTMLRRAVLWASVVPLALFTNAVRMTLILLAGSLGGRGVAQFVHDNEAPVLIFLCMLGLLAIRQGVLSWSSGPQGPREAPHAAPA